MTVCRVPNRPQIAYPATAAGIVLLVLLAAGTVRGQAPRLFYETDGAGTAIVFAPDWAHDTGSWFRLLPLLRADGRRLVRYDLRGQGRSEIPADGDYSLAAHRSDLRVSWTGSASTAPISWEAAWARGSSSDSRASTPSA